MIKKYGAKVRKRRKGVKGVKEEEGNRKKNIVPGNNLCPYMLSYMHKLSVYVIFIYG